MKRLWIAAALLALVVGLCLTTEIYQHRRVEDTMALLDELEQAYDDGNLRQAQQTAEQLTQQYESVCRVLMCFTAHSDIAESQETAALLPTLLRQDGTEELKMEIARLREQLAYLRSVDDPLLWNIL